MERRGTVGSFKRHCKRAGYDRITAKCLQEALKSRDKRVRAKARWYANVQKARRRR